MLKAGGESLDLQPLRDGRLLAIFPADDRRQMHRRKQILLGLRQDGIGADLALNVEGSSARPQASAPTRRVSASDNDLMAGLIPRLRRRWR